MRREEKCRGRGEAAKGRRKGIGESWGSDLRMGLGGEERECGCRRWSSPERRGQPLVGVAGAAAVGSHFARQAPTGALREDRWARMHWIDHLIPSATILDASECCFRLRIA
jgi:hypothetical protein